MITPRPGRLHLGDWLGRREALSPDRVALRDAGDGCRPVTYREWNRAAVRTARLLAALGVGRGDRVAVLSRNRLEYLDAWFACGKLGAVLQNLSWRLTVAELARLLDEAAPRVLLYDGASAPAAAGLRDACATRWTGVAMDAGRRASPSDVPITDRAALPAAPLPPLDLTWDDPWVLCYTGGTTGTPKGAVLTHGTIAWNAVNTVVSWGLGAGDVAVLNAPLFHTGGLNVLTAPLVHVGGASIVCGGFDAGQVLGLIRDAGVTVLFGVPAMFLAVLDHPGFVSTDLSRLRLVVSGGAPCPPGVFERMHARGVPFRTGYGLTEAGPNTFWLPDADIVRKAGSVGVPLFHVDVRIVGPDGRECADDEPGELRVRGPHVFAGYWGRPEESAAVMRDGWLCTGDVAVRDGEGHHRIVGRIKDVIISGGENVYPAEVEGVISAHPAVAEAALIGVPDPRWGESGVAVVVPRAGMAVDVPALLGFLGERLARYKLPREVVVVDELPRTAAGKTDRILLRRRLAGGDGSG